MDVMVHAAISGVRYSKELEIKSFQNITSHSTITSMSQLLVGGGGGGRDSPNHDRDHDHGNSTSDDTAGAATWFHGTPVNISDSYYALSTPIQIQAPQTSDDDTPSRYYTPREFETDKTGETGTPTAQEETRMPLHYHGGEIESESDIKPIGLVDIFNSMVVDPSERDKSDGVSHDKNTSVTENGNPRHYTSSGVSVTEINAVFQVLAALYKQNYENLVEGTRRIFDLYDMTRCEDSCETNSEQSIKSSRKEFNTSYVSYKDNIVSSKNIFNNCYLIEKQDTILSHLYEADSLPSLREIMFRELYKCNYHACIRFTELFQTLPHIMKKTKSLLYPKYLLDIKYFWKQQTLVHTCRYCRYCTSSAVCLCSMLV
jgi:hypothetical protein